jgi:pantothenate kinase type III
LPFPSLLYGSHELHPILRQIDALPFWRKILSYAISSNMQLCIDIGSEHIKCALFEGTSLVKTFTTTDLNHLKSILEPLSLKKGIVVCNDPMKASAWSQEICRWNIATTPLICEKYLSRLAPELGDLLLPDTLAKIYGALSFHPINDCLIVDFGTTIRFELISKEGKLLGRSTFPFFDLIFRSLNISPVSLKEETPPPPLGRNPVESIYCGSYFGLLGAVERIVSEIRLASPSPSQLLTVATGTLTDLPAWTSPLSELIDYIHPHLTLEGLNRILLES